MDENTEAERLSNLSRSFTQQAAEAWLFAQLIPISSWGEEGRPLSSLVPDCEVHPMSKTHPCTFLNHCWNSPAQGPVHYLPNLECTLPDF